MFRGEAYSAWLDDPVNNQKVLTERISPMSLSFAFPHVASSHGLPARLFRAGAALARAWTHRRQVVQLLAMDDRMLKDIGLVRSDVVGALETPIDRDPSMLLVVRSVERRAQGRAMDARRARVGREA